MDQQTIDQKVEENEASRPGPKTLVAIIVVGLTVAAYYNWSDLKAALDFI